MDPKQWGPSCWDTLSFVAHGYPEKPDIKDMNSYKELYMAFRNTLPCSECREGYTKIINKLPIDGYLGSRKQLAHWVYLVHNEVNKKLGKDTDLEFKDVYEKYEKHRVGNCESEESQGCSKEETHYMRYIACIFVILLVSLAVAKYGKFL